MTARRSKPEYYREYIIAIVGESRMLETEGCAPAIAQRENQHPQPYRPWADDPDRFRPDYSLKFAAVFPTFDMALTCRASRLLSRGWRRPAAPPSLVKNCLGISAKG